MTYFNQFVAEGHENFSIVIEDDGNVCYAYLLDGDEIIGDVWLYNQSPTPEFVDWNDSLSMPFLNPKVYVDESIEIEVFTDNSNIYLNWNFKEEKLESVSIYLENKLIAILKPSCKPSWSSLVKKDGPLALKL